MLGLCCPECRSMELEVEHNSKGEKIVVCQREDCGWQGDWAFTKIAWDGWS